MKKILAILLSALMALGGLIPAYAQSALEAFNSIAAQNLSLSAHKTTDQYLSEILAGNFNIAITDEDTAWSLASHLDELCAITNRDMAAYAAARGLTVAQVRGAYFRALGNVLKAEILVNPASEGEYRDAQTILSLFLDKESDQESVSSRNTIRAGMTSGHAQVIADNYQLPVDFVEYLIMNEDWEDDVWQDDNDWMNTASWDDDGRDDDDDLRVGSRDQLDRDQVKQLQNRLIALGYLSGKADGIFGAQTESALKEFQLANGLKDDGIFDDDDYHRMISPTAVYRRDYDDSFDDSPDVVKTTKKTTKKPKGSGSKDSYDNS